MTKPTQVPPGYKAPRCACGCDAVIFSPGSEPEQVVLSGVRVTLTRATPDRGWCMPCARASGWPGCYASERTVRA